MKIDRAGARLFVAVSGLPKCPPSVPDEECAKRNRDLSADGIAIIDTASQKSCDCSRPARIPNNFALSVDETRLFVANEDMGRTSVVDIASGKVIASIPVGLEPEGVAATPDGRWVFVTNESDHAVSVIDTRTLKVVRSVSVGQRPRDIAFAPDHGVAYVTGELDASLYRMGLQGDEPATRVLQFREEARPMALVLDAPRQRLYMSTGRGGTVAVMDLAGRGSADAPRLVAEVPVGTRPWGIALSADGSRLYTANGPSNDVSIVDTAALRTISKIPVGRSPWGVVLSPSKGQPPSPQAR
jgi:YVTN family beta-propeller protein